MWDDIEKNLFQKNDPSSYNGQTYVKDQKFKFVFLQKFKFVFFQKLSNKGIFISAFGKNKLYLGQSYLTYHHIVLKSLLQSHHSAPMDFQSFDTSKINRKKNNNI